MTQIFLGRHCEATGQEPDAPLSPQGERRVLVTSSFICGSQRTGSNVLCEALTLSGVAGRPPAHANSIMSRRLEHLPIDAEARTR